MPPEDHVSVREFVETQSLARATSQSVGDLADTVKAFALQNEARHKEHELAIEKEKNERRDSVGRTHRRIDELATAKAVSKAWVGGMIFAGSGLGMALIWAAQKAWESMSSGKPPHP